ncbi:MAG: ABC-F family ATP-binding cassette domain-containing protein [Devosia sp.]
MPATITIANLGWSAPDGRDLFHHLDLSFGPERTGLVGRNGVGKTTLLRLVAGALIPQSGSVTVDGRVAVLRQSVRPGPDETVAGLFGVSEALALLARAERGEADADELTNADWTLEARMAAALAELGLEVAPATPLLALSGGQATRAALAALVFAEPDFLLLDEPTNNLDRAGREAVIGLLARWKAGAVVVSHDRELLDTMDAIVELTALGATRYGGNWSHYRERKALELAAAQHDLADAERRVDESRRTAQLAAERQARRDSAGRKLAAKGGTPRIVLGGMKENAENTGAAKRRLAERQGLEAEGAASAARRRIEVLQPLTVDIPATGLPSGKTVLRLDRVTAGYRQDRPVLRDVSMTVIGPERVAVTGPNGAGKTTLLALITGALRPAAGTAEVMTGFAMLDQRVSLLDPALSIADNFARLNPGADLTACRAALARFMFRADAALQTVGTLSGGQLLRAGLAAVLGASPPPLLILDEPTNHLDIDAIEAVEAGLRAYDGALLVVSHDERFLEAIGVTRRIALRPVGG